MPEPIVVEVERELEDLVPLFMEQRRKDQVAFTQALARGDFETLRMIGHGMAGAGRGYGFDAISDMGEAMEQAAHASDTAKLNKLGRLLIDYMERVTVTYVRSKTT